MSLTAPTSATLRFIEAHGPITIREIDSHDERVAGLPASCSLAVKDLARKYLVAMDARPRRTSGAGALYSISELGKRHLMRADGLDTAEQSPAPEPFHYQAYRPDAGAPMRAGAADAFQLPSLMNGVEVEYKPPMIIGVRGGFNAGSYRAFRDSGA